MVVCFCVLAVMQLAFALHVRNTLRDCASDGARHAALQNRTLDDGTARTRLLVQRALPSRFAENITATATSANGAELVEVTVEASMPMLGPVGGPVRLRAVGHGIRDAR